MGAVISIGGRRVLMPEEFDARRAELVRMLEVQRGRLAVAQAEAAEAAAIVSRLEGGIIEQERWLAVMAEQGKDPEEEEPDAPAEEET